MAQASLQNSSAISTTNPNYWTLSPIPGTTYPIPPISFLNTRDGKIYRQAFIHMETLESKQVIFSLTTATYYSGNQTSILITENLYDTLFNISSINHYELIRDGKPQPLPLTLKNKHYRREYQHLQDYATGMDLLRA
jgi:hypothetical protein